MNGEWEEVPAPEIKQPCLFCKRQWERKNPGREYDPDVVSSRGFGHHSGYSGQKLLCGINATGERWWWRL
jgi:hypothetical protein